MPGRSGFFPRPLRERGAKEGAMYQRVARMQRSGIREHGFKDKPGLWRPPTKAPDFTLFHPGYSLGTCSKSVARGPRRGEEQRKNRSVQVVHEDFEQRMSPDQGLAARLVVSHTDSAMFGMPRIPIRFVAHPLHSRAMAAVRFARLGRGCLPRHPRKSA
ncbi:hypothetical protein SAMN05660284_01279 [Formivibrio citricus]|uniref:Uncharacterized protein n=1 Tax=Formivibrio citricus TaxID=83765 RepID=A0A1I4Y9Y4_9NEIS|nr:hypothetical protein SAMN05660284_01279 [Formivibrio citricus]